MVRDLQIVAVGLVFLFLGAIVVGVFLSRHEGILKGRGARASRLFRCARRDGRPLPVNAPSRR